MFSQHNVSGLCEIVQHILLLIANSRTVVSEALDRAMWITKPLIMDIGKEWVLLLRRQQT